MGNCFKTHLSLENQENLLHVQPAKSSQKLNLIYSLENNQKIDKKIKARFGPNLGKLILDYLDPSLFCADNLAIYELLLSYKNLDGCEKESSLLQPYLDNPKLYLDRLKKILLQVRIIYGKSLFIKYIPYINLFHQNNFWDPSCIQLRRFYTRDVMKFDSFAEEEFVAKSVYCKYCWRCSQLASIDHRTIKTRDSDGDGSEFIKIETYINWHCPFCALRQSKVEENIVHLQWGGREYIVPYEHRFAIDKRRQ